jgi:hypothetical protein
MSALAMASTLFDQPMTAAGQDQVALRPKLSSVAARGGPAARQRTLDELIVGAWEGLTARGITECPVCGGGMQLDRYEAARTHRCVAACGNCGTELS